MAEPKNVTIRGRASYPRWTHAEALDLNAKSTWPKKDEDVTPEVTLLVEQDQLDKLVAHIKNEFIPYVEEQAKKGEKRDALDPKLVKKVLALMESGDWGDTPPHIPIKLVGEKTQLLAPEAVAGVKILGPKGGDFKLEATVWEENQLAIPDPDILTFPVRKPIGETVFTAYAGAYFVATLNLYAFFQSNSVYGIGAGASVIFYMGNLEGERIGGGGSVVDENEIFAD